jgi:hypothetical protein
MPAGQPGSTGGENKGIAPAAGKMTKEELFKSISSGEINTVVVGGFFVKI